MIVKIVISLLLFLLLPTNIFADSNVVINEFYALGSDSDDPDWIEIYNNSDSKVNIEDWQIKDNTETNKVVLSGNICAHNFRKFNFSNRLNNGGDSIRLFDSIANLKDQLTYFSTFIPAHAKGQSTSRAPDGSNIWQVQTSPSPMDDPCADPSPTPSPSMPTSSPAPPQSKSPTPQPSVQLVKSSSPLAKSPQILSEKTEASASSSSSPNPTPSPEGLTRDFTKEKLAPVLIGAGAFLILLSGAFYIWYRRVTRLHGENEIEGKDDES